MKTLVSIYLAIAGLAYTAHRNEIRISDQASLRMESGSAKATVTLAEVVSEAAMLKMIEEFSAGLSQTPMKLDGRDGFVVSSPEKTKLMLREGQSLWVITAEGPDRRALLDQIAGGWKWLSRQ